MALRKWWFEKWITLTKVFFVKHFSVYYRTLYGNMGNFGWIDSRRVGTQ